MVKKVNTKQNSVKSGFTLAEVLVSMLLMSLFFLGTTKVITLKPKQEIQMNPHGFYECYYQAGDNQLYQHRVTGNAVVPAQETESCNFEPPKGVAYLNIHYFRYDNNLGRYVGFNYQDPQFNMPLEYDEPRDIEDDFSFEMRDDDGQLKTVNLDEIRTYLEFTHPASLVYQILDSGEAPEEALIVAW